MTKIELEDVLFELHDKGLRNLKFNMKRVVKRVDAYAKDYAKDYARSLFEAYLDNEKTMAEISQELKQK